MVDQNFKSPNTYESETDRSALVPATPVGVPAGVIGTANRGPAFVPVTVGSFDEFKKHFGDLDAKKFGTHAANEFLKHRTALTFMRVLGAGANSTSAHIDTTQTTGRVASAGFKLEGTPTPSALGRHQGSVQFIAGLHTLRANEALGMPMFTDNSSFNGSTVRLVRGMVFMASGSRLMVQSMSETPATTNFNTLDDSAQVSSGKIKLIVSSTLGTQFGTSEGISGVKVMTASLDPTQPDYFGKVLNTNPDKFVEEQHFLYADFAVDDEIATPTYVAVLSGSNNTSNTSGETTTAFRNAFGAFDTRYKTPSTTWFISQPFGNTEYDLFKFEALDDGEYANKLYKISITNLAASLDDSYPYGTFAVQVRSWDDTDANPQVLEQFSNCSLDPLAENYVGKMIGDRKVTFNFDATVDGDKQIVATGRYGNQSKFVRVVMHDNVENSVIPQKSLPFGFRGLPVVKTNDSLNDTSPTVATSRLAGIVEAAAATVTGSILPPVPFRFKITKGEVSSTGAFAGQPGIAEQTSNQYYWGVKFERNTSPLNPNVNSEKNPLLESYTKFLGIEKLDVVVTGSGADDLNLNKFTLAKVALSNQSLTDITSSLSTHFREAAYIRNGAVDPTTYTLNDGTLTKRVTLAHVLAKSTPADFNRYSTYAKFTNMLFGGFDGVNILDKNARELNDKASSFDARGGAEATFVSPGLTANVAGVGQANSTVKTYLTAIDIMTDPQAVTHNILTIPGIREPFITDYALRKTREYGLAYTIFDIPSYSDATVRLYDDDSTRPDVDTTAAQFDGRAIDNSYGGTYWPDVVIEDANTRRRVKMPASVAALGALAFNDRVSYPWFAPAGFNRAALDFVKNVSVRLNVPDRDRLYDSRINPIATFPKNGFVIFGQKTCQVMKSALDRVNVRRLLLEVKRIVVDEAKTITFEQATPDLRVDFVKRVVFRLGLIQANAGIEKFSVIANETNNTAEDVNQNRMNGKIIVVPTRTVEWIATDFVISNSGVDFV
jgi:hypothetical protein